VAEFVPTTFIDLGLIDYVKAWAFQEDIFNRNLKAKVTGTSTSNYLIFCEHNHVYTLGKSGIESNLLVNNRQLKELMI
jgi:lipoyl(octanoyl) transferase